MNTEEPDGPAGFAALGLRPELLTTIAALGYEEPTPIQTETIPHLLDGRDLLGQAATGTGKTAAFALPILNEIDTAKPDSPLALILVPTRELAMQVSEAFFKYGSEQRIRVVPIYGGQPIVRQLKALDRGVHIVVATPGRAIDHIKRGSLVLDSIRTVVLDEADEMLDMGFTEDIETILEATPHDRQTVLFSATMPGRINSIAKRHQNNPTRISVGRGDTAADQGKIRQSVYFVQRNHKATALGRILDIEAPDASIVFCNTRNEVDTLTETMNGRGYRAEALHGGMDQNQRDRVMSRLRDGTAELLVATDVAARGLDVDSLTHVVNYNVPSAPESYVHRIGRVGRAGREGVAITLAEPRQRRLLHNIERLTKQTLTVEKLPTVADLRARQIELTVEAIRETLADDDLDGYNAVLHGLAGDSNDRDIALAAIKLFHLSRGAAVDEVEIPDVTDERRPKRDRDGRKTKGKFAERKGRDKGEPRTGGHSDTALIFINLGKRAGIRPGDLVGAIANETDLVGREIGPIRVADKFSTVGVPADAIDMVINALSSTTLRGKKANPRRFVD